MEYAYKRVGSESFDSTVDAVERSVGRHGFVVHQCHDIHKRLAAKGFPIRPLVIFEVAPEAESPEEAISLLLPVRVNVYEEGGSVTVSALRPSVFAAIFPERGLDELAMEVEKVVVAIVDGAVDQSAT